VQRDDQRGDDQQQVPPRHACAGLAGARGEQREAERGAEEDVNGARDGGVDRLDQQGPQVPQHEDRGAGAPQMALPAGEVPAGGGELHVVDIGVDGVCRRARFGHALPPRFVRSA